MAGIPVSVCMIAKNEEQYIEQCLRRLLRYNMEIIVVDTGSTDRTKEIAARYTDKLFEFEWCDDFSAARNVSLEAASGEWFLYIDDDEWFEDVSEICEFFESGESRKYGMACYRQRNYPDWSGTCYTDSQVMRMVRMVPGIHFQMCKRFFTFSFQERINYWLHIST